MIKLLYWFFCKIAMIKPLSSTQLNSKKVWSHMSRWNLIGGFFQANNDQSSANDREHSLKSNTNFFWCLSSTDWRGSTWAYDATSAINFELIEWNQLPRIWVCCLCDSSWFVFILFLSQRSRRLSLSERENKWHEKNSEPSIMQLLSTTIINQYYFGSMYCKSCQL